MLDKNISIKITNRDRGSVSYRIPDLDNSMRLFAPGETKEITMEELRKLSYSRGGDALLKDCFIIENKEALQEILGEVEPEYNYTPVQIQELLLKGDMDSFLDCLDFAPEGVINLIKEYAVKLELNDVRKRDAIFEKTGFNVTKAIEINHESSQEEPEKKVRRVNNQADSNTPQRRIKVVKGE